MSTGKTSARGKGKKRPPQWDKMVSAAYLRILGATQAVAAASVGRSERTLWGWENKTPELWREAEAEAESRWLVDLKRASMETVLENVRKGNAVIGQWALERLVPALAPAKQRIQVDLSKLSDEELRELAGD